MNKIYKSIDHKVRIRSHNELEVRKYEFLEICEILNKLGVKYFLLGGILLGAIRNKNFIPWDWDVEICVNSNEIISKFEDLLSAISNSKFKIIKYNKKISNFKLDLEGKLPVDTTKYTIMGWNHNKEKKIFWRNTLKIPDHFIINMKKIELFDKSHFAPYPPNDYLTHQYGDWKEPIQTSNKYQYLTKKYYNRSITGDFVLKIINSLKKIFNKSK